MKNYLLLSLCFVLLTLTAKAQKDTKHNKDTIDFATHHKLNFCFTWFELGSSIALKEKKLRDLPYGMNSYLYGSKGGFAGALFGIGFYYKDHWGISAILNFQDYTVKDAAFQDYITSQYPNYFLPYAVQGHTYTLNKLKYRLSYRFHTKRFVFEPQFQLGINDCDDFDTHFVLKENGSNNFIEYDIKKENTRKNLFSYHAAVVARWKYTHPDWNWNVEPSLRFDFMIIPTNFNYTITSSPYNMPSTIHEVNVKRMRPALTITAVLGVFRK